MLSQALSVDAPAPTVPELVKAAAFAPTPSASVALLKRAHVEAPPPVVSTPAELLMREATTCTMHIGVAQLLAMLALPLLNLWPCCRGLMPGQPPAGLLRPW